MESNTTAAAPAAEEKQLTASTDNANVKAEEQQARIDETQKQQEDTLKALRLEAQKLEIQRLESDKLAAKTQELMQQQIKLMKKIHRSGVVRTWACIAMAVIMLVSAVKVVPQVLTLIAHSVAFMDELSIVTENLAAVDFAAISNQINQLAAAGTEGISTATAALSETMKSLNSINFDALNDSVEGLSRVVENLAAVSNVMGRLFG